jgi:hypothetical protein
VGRQFTERFRREQEPRPVERKLFVIRVEPHLLENLYIEDGGVNLDLPMIEGLFTEEYNAVSHTFTVRDDGVGILSILFERLKPL